eukprot:m.831332 g.831332  ORF g.831332 m.831332 type:complete len:365 (+) comp23430_c0_seq23:1091-2185(+)
MWVVEMQVFSKVYRMFSMLLHGFCIDMYPIDGSSGAMSRRFLAPQKQCSGLEQSFENGAKMTFFDTKEGTYQSEGSRGYSPRGVVDWEVRIRRGSKGVVQRGMVQHCAAIGCPVGTDVWPRVCCCPFCVVFLILGVLCGLLGAAFIFWHRRVVELRRQYEGRFSVFKRSRYVYVCMVAVVIACSTYPGGIGQHMGLSQTTEITHLFSSARLETQHEWSSGNIFVNLLVFITVKFFLVPLAVSLPIPAGVFVPVFVLGAGFGRLVGEVMADTIKDGTCTVGGVRVQPVPCVGFAAGTRLRHCPLQITLAPSTTRRARLTDPWALFQAGIVAYMWGFENMHTVVRRVQCRPQGTLCRAPCAGDRDD